MKKFILLLLIVHCTLLIVPFSASRFFGNDCLCQWQADVRLTNDPAESETSNCTAWHIAANGNVVHAIWSDGRNPGSEIYYKNSTNGGISWGADTRLTNDPGGSYSPSISVTGQVIHVAWCDNRNGNGDEIYYIRSTNGGINWGTETRMTNAPSWSQAPSLSVSELFVHLVWGDNRNGNYEIYYKRSTDGGVTWGTDTRLTINTGESHMPSIAVSGNTVHVLFSDNRDGDYEIYYKCSTDGGNNWGSDTRLTNSVGYSAYSSAVASGLNIHVVWFDARDGNEEIYYKHSTNNGATWGTDIRLTNNSGVSRFPNLSVSGSALHVVWRDNRDGNYEIYYKRSINSGSNWETDTRLTNNSGSSDFPSIALYNSTLHVLWTDNRDGNYEIYYKQNPTGNQSEIKKISTDIPSSYLLGQNYPNPFNLNTIIRFKNKDFNFISLKVYDIDGKEVAILANDKLVPGTYEVYWNASELSSGVYFYKLTTNNFSETKQMILIK